MQATSATWKALWASGNARMEARATISGNAYSTEITAPVISRAMMREGLMLGSVVSASCMISIETTDSIPKSAGVLVEMRLTDGNTSSEWLPAGTFYISRRGRDAAGRMALECYDALLKANAVWTPSPGSWPRSMAVVLAELAGLLGLSVDSRTSVTAYSMAEPEAGTTIREALSRIGAANGGGWIVTPAGKLRLAPLRDGQTAAGASDAAVVQGVLRAFEYGTATAVTGIRYYTDGEPVVLGNETGAVVDIGQDATAAQDLYTALSGIGYQAFSLSGAVYDPAAELGDGLSAGINGEIRSQLCAETVTLGPLPQGDISAPPVAELADEYPYIDGAADRALIAAKAYAQSVTDALDTSLDQQAIFNRLTDNGAAQGLYMLNGQLYMNASYINAGSMSADRISGGTIDGSTVNAKLLNIVDGSGNVIASFNSVITLGKATDARAEMDFNSFEIKDSGGNLFFSVGDARDANGQATVSDRFVGNGNLTFILNLTAISISEVTVDGTQTSDWTLSSDNQQIRFTTAPAEGAEIIVTYVTDQPVYHYDIGTRYSNTVVGAMSTAIGYLVEASGFGSYAEGQATHARGYLSHAEGDQSKADGYASHAEGYGTEAIRRECHAEGYQSQAIGAVSHAEGYITKAGGPYSHAEGWETVTSGYAVHAEGYGTEASGHQSHAEGYGTKASGPYSHAEGKETVASGYYSHAEGFHTKAGDYQHVSGKYNASVSNALEIVGNGTSDSARSNARTLDTSGNEWIAGALSVGDAAGTRSNLGAMASSGGTMTGNLVINVATAPRVTIRDTIRNIGFIGLSSTKDAFGVYSNGYFDANGDWVSNAKYLISRNSSNIVTFNGNATTASSLKTPRTLTIGNTGKSFDGSSDVAWSLNEMGAAGCIYLSSANETTWAKIYPLLDRIPIYSTATIYIESTPGGILTGSKISNATKGIVNRLGTGGGTFDFMVAEATAMKNIYTWRITGFTSASATPTVGTVYRHQGTAI